MKRETRFEPTTLNQTMAVHLWQTLTGLLNGQRQQPGLIILWGGGGPQPCYKTCVPQVKRTLKTNIIKMCVKVKHKHSKVY